MGVMRLESAHRFRIGAPFLLLALGAAYSSEAPPGLGNAKDSGTTNTLCDPMNPCGDGFTCVGGVCEANTTLDGSVGDANGPQGRLQVCTPEGCNEPLRMNFG